MFPSYLDFHRDLIGNDYAGRRITLTVWLWHTKIRRAHPELIGPHLAVLNAFAAPFCVMRDKTYSYRLCYYQEARSLGLPFDEYLKVVVDFRTNPALVVTAYLVGRVHQREMQVWP